MFWDAFSLFCCFGMPFFFLKMLFLFWDAFWGGSLLFVFAFFVFVFFVGCFFVFFVFLFCFGMPFLVYAL